MKRFSLVFAVLLAGILSCSVAFAEFEKTDVDRKNIDAVLAAGEIEEVLNTFGKRVKFTQELTLPTEPFDIGNYRIRLMDPKIVDKVWREDISYPGYKKTFRFTKLKNIKAGDKWLVFVLPKEITDEMYLDWFFKPWLKFPQAGRSSEWLFVNAGGMCLGMNRATYARAIVFDADTAQAVWGAGNAANVRRGSDPRKFQVKLLEPLFGQDASDVPGLHHYIADGEILGPDKKTKTGWVEIEVASDLLFIW